MALDKYREDLHRRLMLYHYGAGEQNLSLRVFRSYTGLLRDELGATPSADLERLKNQVEARDVPGVDGLRRYPKPRRPLRLPYSLSRTHFVGRDGEYGLLAERLREVSAGNGSAIAVEGEAGIGKTRLAEEFLGYAHARGVRILRGRCYERELGPPLEPVMEAMEALGSVEHNVADVVHGMSEAYGAYGESSGRPWTDKPYGVARIYHELTGWLIRESRANGLILFVDDLQWADPTTLDFLSYLAKRVSDEGIMLVLTYRREQASDLFGWLERLAERRAVTKLSLERLSLEDVYQILIRMSARSFEALSSLAEFIYLESEGNPFYALEYLRWLIESGAVEIDSRRRISGLKDKVLMESALPSGVRTLIQARFGGLSEEARELLEVAAVTGRSFDLGLLCSVAGFGEIEAFTVMKPLMSSGLIVETSQDEKYHFSHDKLRQVLYEDIASPRRRIIHLRVAEALEEKGGEPAELAHHYMRAEDWRPALENLVRAGRKAETGHAWETASSDYGRALKVAEMLPDSEETKFDLLAARESLFEHMNRREERITTVQELFELANNLGDQTRIAEVHIRRIGILMVEDPEEAAKSGRVAVDIFRELNNAAGEARAHREMGYARWMNRDYAGALEANLQALWIHRNLGYRRAEAGDATNIAQVYRGMGDYYSALRWAEEAVQIDHEMGDTLSEGFKMNTVANIHRERGDLEAALSLHLESLTMCTELGIKNLRATQHLNCGRLYLGLAAPEEALEHFRSAARLGQGTGYTRDEGYALTGVGVCLEHSGDPAGAAETYQRAVELMEKTCEDSGSPEDLVGKAEALSLLGTVLHYSLFRPAGAFDAYVAAATVYRGLKDLGRLRKLLMKLAGLCWKMGSLEKSASHYEEALELAREHGETAHRAAALASLSVIYRALGRFRDSIRGGKQAIKLLRELDDPQAEAYVLTSLADSYQTLGHHPSALSCLKRSLRLRRKIGDEVGEVGALYDLARVYESLGDTVRAREVAEEAWCKEETSKEAPVPAPTTERRS